MSKPQTWVELVAGFLHPLATVVTESRQLAGPHRLVEQDPVRGSSAFKDRRSVTTDAQSGLEPRPWAHFALHDLRWRHSDLLHTVVLSRALSLVLSLDSCLLFITLLQVGVDGLGRAVDA